jgi:asparagine synthase (glutamine-hydrolysing)
MCGIAATVRLDGRPVDEALLLRMRDTLVHRGPDDQGVWCDGTCGLAHRRLAIVDLSPAGRQPIANEDGTVWITFNGEIYNYVELMAELRARGHTFRSACDTEVIVHLYEEMGERCVERLNGMFSFCIWDTRTRRLFCARDRMGIKPFYWHADAQRFSMASEIKALLADPAVGRAPDWEGLADYFLAGYAMGGKTVVAGVRELPPAHTLTVADGRVTMRKYWDVEYRYDERRSQAALVDDLAALIDDAVRIHCRSDAPLGCHLSGGMDSSLTTALATRHYGRLGTFSVNFGMGGFYDESHHARAVAEHVGADHKVATYGAADLSRLFASLTWHMDVPIADAVGFSYYAVSRLASQHVTVSLTGHGGDEVFGGYPAQFQTAYGRTDMFDLSARPPVDDARPLVSRLLGLARRDGLGGLARRAMSRLRPAAPPTPEALWQALHCGPEPRRNPVLSPRFLERLGGYSPVDAFLAPFTGAPTDRLFDRCLYHDLRSYLPLLLLKEDRASMAVSIESRVPLLDYRIVEFMATVPPEQKVPGLLPKALLRAVGRPLLPSAIVDRRDKTPFPVPLREWLATDLMPQVRAVLGDARSLDRGVYAPDVLRSPATTAGELLSMYVVEMWFRVMMDDDPAYAPQLGRAHGELAEHITARHAADARAAMRAHPAPTLVPTPARA